MISPEELKNLCDRIVKSGELGRSRTYAAILDYLAGHAIAGTYPKEISIAIDVLGREASFDVGKDSIVRVHIYHLRTKLNTYFARQGALEKYRIEIPKGQYTLAISEHVVEPLPANGNEGGGPATGISITGKPLARRSYTSVLAGFAILMLAANLWFGLDQANTQAGPIANSQLWRPLFDDEMDILVLVGDYYIMGEEDAGGNVLRMVREFDINSADELAQLQGNGLAGNYRNLDMGYAPTSVPAALTAVMQVLGPANGRVTVKLMSQFTTDDLVGNHVIYLGLLSGMRSLTELLFAASGLGLGATYDELINLDDDTLYSSSSGLTVGEASYRDYGMLSSFASPSGGQIMLLAGMRDEGLINLAEEVTTADKLTALESAVGLDAGGEGEELAFEALYEVLGFDNTNFDATLVYNRKLDTKVLWETRLIGVP